MRTPSTLLLLSLLAACAGPSATRDPSEQSPPSAAATSATVAQRLEAARPGSELAALDALIGAWRVQVLQADAAGELAPLAAGRAELAPSLGGRFLEWRTEVLLGGRPVRSFGVLGFDREREVFELYWLSETSSAQRIARGRGDARRGGVTLESADLDPESGGLRRWRSTLRIASDDVFTLRQEAWDPALEDWRELALTRYTRAPEPEAGAGGGG